MGMISCVVLKVMMVRMVLNIIGEDGVDEFDDGNVPYLLSDADAFLEGDVVLVGEEDGSVVVDVLDLHLDHSAGAQAALGGRRLQSRNSREFPKTLIGSGEGSGKKRPVQFLHIRAINYASQNTA